MSDKTIQILTDFGLSEEEAKNLLGKLNGVDYLDLMMSVDDNNSEVVQKIVDKYAEKVEENVFSIESYSSPDRDLLEAEGFSVYTKVHESDIDTFYDWLDENCIEYQNDDVDVFLIKPKDRSEVYKINRFVGGLNNGRTVFQDELAEAKKNKKEKEITRQNPFVANMVRRTGGGGHTSTNPEKTDKLSRKAKHKKKIQVDESHFKYGDEVKFDNNEATVIIPEGPRNTIGIKINGVTKMVSKNDDRLVERALGMSTVPSLDLNRMRKLAGITEDAFDPNDTEGLDNDVNSDVDMNGDIESDLADFDDMVDFDMTADAPVGAPGDVGTMVGDDESFSIVDDSMSSAYSEIISNINNIQDKLGDISLSEYRALISSLSDLSVQIKNMGKAYLSESRK